MADGLIQKLDALAQVINNKAGTTGGMTIDEMTTKVNNISVGEDVTAEVNEYTSLTTELESAINKLPEAGSGSAAVIEPLNITTNGTYTAPDGIDGCSPITVNVKSSSSSGTNIETVTVTVVKGEVLWISVYDAPEVHYTTVVDGIITYQKISPALNSTYEITVVKDSILFALNGPDGAATDSEWDSTRQLAGGLGMDFMGSGADRFMGGFRINQACTIILD